MVFFFKCVRGMVNINVQVLPELQSRGRTTRSTDIYKVFNVYNKTVQDINFSEIVCHSFNKGVEHTSKKLTEKNTNFSSFKNGLYEYYKSALSNYDAEYPRTWKSICLSCNMCRNLSCPILCCC